MLVLVFAVCGSGALLCARAITAMFIIINHVQAVLLGLKMERSIVEDKGLFVLEHKITFINIHSNIF